MAGVVSQEKAQQRPRFLRLGLPVTAAVRFRERLARDLKNPTYRSDLFIAVCSMLVGIFSVCTMVAAGYLNYSRLPWHDAWTLWWVRLSRIDFWSFLFTLHNGHRIPVPRLLYLADEKLFHAEAWSLLLCTFLSQFATCLILYWLIRSKKSTVAYSATIFGLIMAFLFSASQWINFTSTLEVCFVFVYVTSIGALAALAKSAGYSRSQHPWICAIWLAVSIVMAFLAVGTSATGVVVWPLLVLLGFFLRLSRVVRAALIGLAIGIPFAYLHNYKPDKPVIPTDLMSKTPDLVAFALTYLGSAFNEPLMYLTKSVGLNWEAYQVPLAAAVGALGIGWFFHIILAAIREPLPLPPGRITLLHVAGFLVGSAALSSIGRIQFSMMTALTSRYTTPSVMFWACLFVLAIGSHATEANTGRSYRLRTAALFAALLVGGLIQLPKVAYAIDCGRYVREEEYAIINNVFEPNVWERLSYSAGRMIPVVSYFRQNHLAMFSPDWTRWVGDPATKHFRVASKPCDCIGEWAYSSSLAYSFRPSTVSEGWVYDQRLKRTPKMIVFADNANRILGFTSCTRTRQNVTAAHPEFTNDVVGWVAYLPTGVAKDAIAYAVLEDGRSLCPFGNMHLPGAYAMAPASKAGAVISGVEAKPDSDWSTSLPRGFGKPPFDSRVFSSYQLRSRTGELRLGPVGVSGGSSIGLPVATGPDAKSIRLSVINVETNEVLSVAEVPPGAMAWDLWRFDNPTGDLDLKIQYVIQDAGDGPNDWVAVAIPRKVNP